MRVISLVRHELADDYVVSIRRGAHVVYSLSGSDADESESRRSEKDVCVVSMIGVLADHTDT